MRVIVVDTSSILFALEMKSDIFEVIEKELPEYKIRISQGVIEELKKAAKGTGRKAQSARIALELIRRHNIEISGNKRYVDAWISEEAKNNAICTNDTELRKKIKREGGTAYAFSKSRRLV